MLNHDRDWIHLTCDLKVNMSIEEFDNLSRRRISRIMNIQEARLKSIEEEKERLTKEAEKAAKQREKQQQIQQNNRRGKSQRIPIN